MATRKTVPTLPAKCFDHSASAYLEEVLPDNTNRTTVFAQLGLGDYETIDDIVAVYTDFEKWGEYAANAGTGAIVFKDSRRLGDVVIDGEVCLRHYAHFFMKGPLGIKSEISALIYNKMVEAYDGADRSLEFFIAPEGTQVPELGAYQAKGVKDLRGNIHVKAFPEQDRYVVTCVMDAHPTLDFAPNIAKDYIGQAVVSIVKGMFGL